MRHLHLKRKTIIQMAILSVVAVLSNKEMVFSFIGLPGMLFGSYVMPFTILALGFWLGWRFGTVCTMAAVTTVAITNPMKHWIGRDRPQPLEAQRAIKIRKLVSNPAFPSGDSAQAGAITTLLILLGPLPLPVSLVFLGYWLLGERISLVQIVGTAVVLCGVMVLTRRSANQVPVGLGQGGGKR